MRRSLTFEAALRDLAAERPEARALALRLLPGTYLERLGLAPPVAHAAALHPDGARAVTALHAAHAREPIAELRGIALWALAMLGDPGLVALADQTLSSEEDPYLHESAVQALGILGMVLEPSGEATPSVEGSLTRAVEDPRPHVRAAACDGLVRAGFAAAEAAIVAAFDREPDDDVREAMVEALAALDPPGEAACRILGEAVLTPAHPPDTRFAAARGLAAGRRMDGARLLVEALARPFQRDDAMEALAVLAPRLPPALRTRAAAHARRIARGLFVPATTRVRAAYLLARIESEAGLRLLARLSRRRSRAVQEAVADARAALARLADEGGDPATT